MKKEKMEGFLYYLSCMVCFNMIVFFRTWSVEDAKGISLISLILILIGIKASICIFVRDNSRKDDMDEGMDIDVREIKDITGDGYISAYSLMVATALALPISDQGGDILIFALVICTLGIVYIKKRMYHINPILTMCGYSVYKNAKCNGKTILLVTDIEEIEEYESIKLEYSEMPTLRVNSQNALNRTNWRKKQLHKIMNGSKFSETI